MVEFVGLPWDESCLRFHSTARTVRTFSKWQVRQQISTGSVQRWRRYAAHVGPLMRLSPAAAATSGAMAKEAGGSPAASRDAICS